jgi:hypothetical protein
LGNTADKVGGYDYDQTYYSGPWSEELGYGRVNAYKAVLAARNYTGHEDLSGIADIAKSSFPLEIFPNPVVGSVVKLQFNLPTTTDAYVNVMGLDGRMVYQQDLGLLFDGANEHTLNLDRALAPGAYLVGLTAGSQTTYSKLVVIGQQ